MKRLIPVLVTLALMVCMASIVFARGGPPGEQAVTSTAAVEQVTPFVATVPAQVGYDVIQNISRDSATLIAVSESVTTARRGLSTTGYWRSNYAASTSQTSRSAPNNLRMLR